MYNKSSSLAFVINGDWNRLYTQPDWIAKNVYEMDSIDSKEKVSLDYFCSIINKFVSEAYTPHIVSYGLNVDFIDDGDRFANMTDEMTDSQGLIDCGIEIVDTRIHRTVKMQDVIFNLDCSIKNGKYLLHINEHHEGVLKQDDFPAISKDYIERFFDNCWIIARAQGYDMEETDE